MMMMVETDDHQDFDQGDHGTSTTFSQLLFGDDDVQGQGFNNYVFSSCFPAAAAADQKSTPKMLCFGDHRLHHHQTQSAAAITHVKTTHPSKSNRKRNGARFTEEDAIVAAQPAATRKPNKKSKVDNLSTSTGHAKVRKEKIGDRISALQQLVSPFGKTDTASVLHEAMGYIRFLQDQVQALCSPYLQQHPPHDGGENGSGSEDLLSKELKSRGLCLVPVACIVHVANSSNGADLWSPAAMGDKEINL